jgi:hypothetical protein
MPRPLLLLSGPRQAHSPTATAHALVLGLVAVSLAGCGPLADRDGQLAISPTTVNLRAGAAGSTVSVPLTLMNVGQGGVQVQRWSFAVSTGYSLEGPALPLRLAPGAELVLQLEYRPGPGVPLSNTLRIESDGETTAQIELNALPAPAVLTLVPGSVEFGAVASGSREERVVAVQNLGLAAAESLRLSWLEGGADFSAGISAERIEAGGLVQLRVGYAPRGGDSDQAQLQLRWNSGEALVRVSGRQDLQPPD